MQRIFISLILAGYFCFSSDANAQRWASVPIKEAPNFVISESSIEVYPGSVAFVSRYTQGKIDFYKKSIFLCGSSEVYGVALIAAGSGESPPPLVSDITNRGRDDMLNIPQIANYMSKKCAGQISKTELEVPISLSSDDATFILAKSSKISKRFINLWEKSYPYERKELVISGEKVMIDGKPFLTTNVFKDRGYKLFNFQYDCDQGTYETLGSVEYDSSGKLKSSHDFSSLKSSPKRIIPETIGMTVFEYACGLKR